MNYGIYDKNEMKDFYFSQNRFESSYYVEHICLVKIDGILYPYTECITVDKDPLSWRWGDLVYVGSAPNKDIKIMSKLEYNNSARVLKGDKYGKTV